MYIREGEMREVGIRVINKAGDSFKIEAAEYFITKKDSSTEIERGVADIEEREIKTLFKGKEKGEYYLNFRYHIADEILISRVFIEVWR